jgi:hypothetical protein
MKPQLIGSGTGTSLELDLIGNNNHDQVYYTTSYTGSGYGSSSVAGNPNSATTSSSNSGSGYGTIPKTPPAVNNSNSVNKTNANARAILTPSKRSVLEGESFNVDVIITGLDSEPEGLFFGYKGNDLIGDLSSYTTKISTPHFGTSYGTNIKIVTAEDNRTEGIESLIIDIYLDSILSNSIGTTSVDIVDKALIADSTKEYVITVSSATIDEGATIKTSVTTKETLENPARLRENGAVITGQDWVDGWQAARLLGLRAHHGQEADQKGEVSL